MIFKGIKFRQSRKAVTLRNDGTQYIKFGMAVWGATDDQNGTLVQTDWTNAGTGEPIWARPIPLDYHSLTNMAYAKNGRVYLAKDGRVYVAPRRLPCPSGPWRAGR